MLIERLMERYKDEYHYPGKLLRLTVYHQVEDVTVVLLGSADDEQSFRTFLERLVNKYHFTEEELDGVLGTGSYSPVGVTYSPERIAIVPRVLDLEIATYEGKTA